MNKEDYVSLEVAKMLKEKGFDEQCRYTYCGESEEDVGVSNNKNSNYPKSVYSMPTLYQAQKWLRINKNIHVNADYEVWREKWFFSLCLIYAINLNHFEDMSESIYNSYEEALNEGIKEALKYI